MCLSHLYIVVHFILFTLDFHCKKCRVRVYYLKLFFKPTANKLYYYYGMTEKYDKKSI